MTYVTKNMLTERFGKEPGMSVYVLAQHCCYTTKKVKSNVPGRLSVKAYPPDILIDIIKQKHKPPFRGLWQAHYDDILKYLESLL